MADGDTSETELHSHIALALVPGLGPKLTAALLAQFGSATAALRATAGQLRQVPLIGDKLADAFSEAFRSVDVNGELALLAKHGVTPVLAGDPRYPARLTTIDDAPSLVYLRGEPVMRGAKARFSVGSKPAGTPGSPG